MDKPLKFHLPWITWAIIIGVLSLLPGNQLPKIELNWISIDSLVHIAMYSVLSIFLLIGFYPVDQKIKNKLNLLKSRLYIIVIAVGLCYGWTIELLQGLCIPGRNYDTRDLVANSFGTIFGVIVMHWTSRKLI